MKKLLILLASIFLIPLINLPLLIAQEKNHKSLPKMTVEQKAELQVNWMTKQLKLDEKTAKTVYSIQLKYLIQTDSVLMISKNGYEKKIDHGLIFRNKSAELKAILTPEQYNQYMIVFDSKKDKVQLTLN